jgi:hypothetical protein
VLETSEDASRLVDGLYLPGLSSERAEAAKRALTVRARAGRTLPVPLRRFLTTAGDQA